MQFKSLLVAALAAVTQGKPNYRSIGIIQIIRLTFSSSSRRRPGRFRWSEPHGWYGWSACH